MYSPTPFDKKENEAKGETKLLSSKNDVSLCRLIECFTICGVPPAQTSSYDASRLCVCQNSDESLALISNPHKLRVVAWATVGTATRGKWHPPLEVLCVVPPGFLEGGEDGLSILA